MLTRELDFDLPPELIAQTPIEPRDAARLLCLKRRNGAVTHRFVRDLPELLRAGDLLVLNDTRVLRARLRGHKSSGGRVEALLLKERRARGAEVWEALLKPSARLQTGGEIEFSGAQEGRAVAVKARLLERAGAAWLVQFLPPAGRTLRELLPFVGEVPLPPYIHQGAEEARYQTTFARASDLHAENPLDSAAAPTAGLHFTPELFRRLEARGVERSFVTLAVGAGTFAPVKVEDLDAHPMHAEEFWIAPEVAARINAHKAAGGRVVAVGTTAVRALESAAGENGVRAGAGETRLFLRPGAPFRVVDALLTNFHLPRSTLLALVAAFIEAAPERAAEVAFNVEKPNGENSSTEIMSGGTGLEVTQRVYREAIASRYRFFSFGDAMLIE